MIFIVTTVTKVRRMSQRVLSLWHIVRHTSCDSGWQRCDSELVWLYLCLFCTTLTPLRFNYSCFIRLKVSSNLFVIKNAILAILQFTLVVLKYSVTFFLETLVTQWPRLDLDKVSPERGIPLYIIVLLKLCVFIFNTSSLVVAVRPWTVLTSFITHSSPVERHLSQNYRNWPTMNE